MNCSDWKHDLALYAGGDLSDRTQVAAVRQHLSSCSGCQQDLKRLRQSLTALATPPRAETFDSTTSVWNSLSKKLRQSPQVTLRRRLMNWQTLVPVGSIAAACLVALVTWSNSHNQPTNTELIPGGMLSVPQFPSTKPPKKTTPPVVAPTDDVSATVR
ncbi:MAG: zf-HC2 domain-containing protein [Planctomycetaceae bacterium]